MEADQNVGRKHFPIVLGRKKSSILYILFLLFTYLTIITGVYLQLFPNLTLIAIATVFIAVPLSVGVYKNADDVKKLLPFMGLNVMINIITPVLFAVGFFWG